MQNIDPLRIVANLTHELKTPLHAILSTASILGSEIDGKLSPEQKKQVGIVLKNGQHLLEMISSLLSYSSTVTTSRSLNLVRLDLSKTLSETFQEIKPLAVSKGINLSFQGSASIKHFYSDKDLVLRIFSNILSNAIKFTKEGGSIDVLVDDLENDSVRIRIVDTGVGMSLETKEKIFAAFFQADSSSTREFGGVGLGLSLVKVAVEQINAKLKVESEIGKGSIFTVDIPNLRDSLPKKTIGTINVDETLRASLEIVLKEEGYTLITIEDPMQLSQEKEIADLILFDGVTGEVEIELMKNLRRNGFKLPLLGLLSSKDSNLRHLALEAGFNETIFKPFDVKEILYRIRQAIGKKDSGQEE